MKLEVNFEFDLASFRKKKQKNVCWVRECALMILN